MFPDEEGRAADVVGIVEADEEAIAVGCGRRGARRLTAAERDDGEGTLADTVVPVVELHAHRGLRVAAGIAILNLASDRLGGCRLLRVQHDGAGARP